MNVKNNDYVRFIETNTIIISIIKMPRVSALYSQVKSSFAKIITKNIPRQNVLFMHAAPCS